MHELPVAANDAFIHAWRKQGRRCLATGLLVTACAVAALLGWSLWAPLAGAVVASGQVRVDTHRKTVQHRDGGIVREILVREGDRVAAGQLLLSLDDARIDAAFEVARTRLDASRIRQARLLAETTDATHWELPPEVATRLHEPRVAEAAARESGLYTTRRSSLEAQERLLRQQIEAIAVEVAAREREFESLRTATSSMREELQLNESLLQQRYVSRTRVMQLDRNVAEYRSRIDANRAELAQARQRRADLELRLASLHETFRQEAAAELRDATAHVVEQEEELRNADDAAQRKRVTAPVAGRVLDLRVTTQGGSIGPREPILDLVPDDAPLLIEARVGVDSIAELHTGAPAEVRLTAYRQRTTPLIAGTVVYVSPDALSDRATGATYYVMQVALDRASLERAGPVAVQPGMGAEVFVRTQARTALDFLLEPVVNAARRSMRGA
jgi:HlyD family type I secretion membrane fusion protein